MSLIELVWDEDCPNIEAARVNLSEALRRIGAAPSWTEWRRDDPAAPDHARRAGSPAILVDGRDVEGHENGGETCCRVYVDATGKRASAPEVETIVSALEAAARGGSHGRSVG